MIYAKKATNYGLFSDTQFGYKIIGCNDRMPEFEYASVQYDEEQQPVCFVTLKELSNHNFIPISEDFFYREDA